MQLWPEKGSANTDGTIKAALSKAKELGIKNIVVASNSGATAQLLANKGLNIICVSHHVGFAKPGDDEMGTRARRLLQELGVKVLTTTHLFAGIDRAMRNHFQGIYPAEIVAGTLRLFGQGIKVCVEISVMALDAGLIPYGEEVIAIGGSSQGADAAMVISPAHSSQFLDTKIKEIICMPRDH